MEPVSGSWDRSTRSTIQIGTRWTLTSAKATPTDYLANTRQRWKTVSSPLMASMARTSSSGSLLEEMSSLLRERVDLFAQLFDAAQIQRKLSGPRVLRNGELQFASEVFAARFLSGDFTTFSQNGSHVSAVLGDIGGKSGSAGMWFPPPAGVFRSYRP